MRVIKNISPSKKSIVGVGEVKPGQAVVVSDEIGRSCATAPHVWEVTCAEVEERALVTFKPRKEQLQASIKEKLAIRKPDVISED